MVHFTNCKMYSFMVSFFSSMYSFYISHRDVIFMDILVSRRRARDRLKGMF